MDSQTLQSVVDHTFDGVYLVDRDRRITYWNSGAERMTGYSPEEVVGSMCHDNILQHVDLQGEQLCQNGCPLAETISDGKRREVEVYLRHKQGHRLLVAIRTVPIYNSDGQRVGACEIFRDQSYQAVVRKRMRQLETLALVDPLTRLPNRRHTEAVLQARLGELVRYSWPFGMLFIDIDHFKDINDNYGHSVGDKVLTLVARTLQNSLRPFDFLGRWGGEEFVGIIINVELNKLAHIAKRALRLLEQSKLIVEEGELDLTVSIGATMARKEDTPLILLHRADRLMYRSKAAGRNRVTIE